MNYRKVFENWIGFVSGVWGGGFGYSLNILWSSEILKIVFAALTAGIAGFAGIGGKYFFVYLHRRTVKYFTKKQHHVKQIEK